MAKPDEILELLKRISDNSDALQGSLLKMDKKVDLHIQKTELELERIKEMDDVQNKLLDQHIEGVNTLKKWCDQHEEANRLQFEKLEEPRKFIVMLFKLILAAGSVAGAAAAIMHYLK